MATGHRENTTRRRLPAPARESHKLRRGASGGLDAWCALFSPARASQLQELSMAPAAAAVAAASPTALPRSSSPRGRRPRARACSFRCARPSARPSALVSSYVSQVQVQHKLQAYPLLSFQLALVLCKTRLSEFDLANRSLYQLARR
jgi:hypothetical protein